MQVQKAPQKEATLQFKPCIREGCHKKILKGYYGRWGDGGVCSAACNAIMETKPKEYPDDPERSRTAAR